MKNEFRAFLLGMIVVSQVFVLVALHESHTMLGGMTDLNKHPAQKKFTVDRSDFENFTVSRYDETFTRANEFLMCGWISREVWRPRLEYTNDENYAAYIQEAEGQTTEREFKTLLEAEDWLFAQGCPDKTWRRQ